MGLKRDVVGLVVEEVYMSGASLVFHHINIFRTQNKKIIKLVLKIFMADLLPLLVTGGNSKSKNSRLHHYL